MKHGHNSGWATTQVDRSAPKYFGFLVPLLRALSGVNRQAIRSVIAGIFGFGFAASTAWSQALPVLTTVADYFLPGTQPDPSGKVVEPLITSFQCSFCHEVDAEPGSREVPIFNRWRGSMKGNSARDPIFHAALAIANQDAAFAGDLCLRCHTPGAWLAGRANPPDGSALNMDDMDGVTCTVCHRMVDPVLRPGTNPPADQPILAALSKAGLLPTAPGSGNYVIDPADSRRGPFDDVPQNLHGVPMYYSPFHLRSELCATCHDVSNPALIRQEDGSYRLDALNTAHATGEKQDMFPLERTYSEWANSDYSKVGVFVDGVFGGNHPTGIMRSCQDCHMPLAETYGCAFQDDPFFVRPNIPSHDFSGGNAWVQDMLTILYPNNVLNHAYLNNSMLRAQYMLQNAATVEVTHDACSIQVRVTNETGHKLPTGYAEGRRMWIHVLFRDEHLNIIANRGRYNETTARLTTLDTKVYEAVHGVDAVMAEATGVAEGPSFHFVLNNQILKDNRIPPRGFTNSAFAAARAEPVGAVYHDGQYWDDTEFRVPQGATVAIVTLFYQTSSREYIEFLRDENRTNDAGDDLYDLWLLTDMSPPVKMRQVLVTDLTSGEVGDSDCDTDRDLVDFAGFSRCFTGPSPEDVSLVRLGCEAFNADDDGDIDLGDYDAFRLGFLGP